MTNFQCLGFLEDRQDVYYFFSFVCPGISANAFLNVVLLCCGLCGFYEVDPTLKKSLVAFGGGSGGDGREKDECKEDILHGKVGSMKAKTLCLCVF